MIILFMLFSTMEYKTMIKSAPNTRIKSFQEPNLRLVISNFGCFGNAGEYSN